MQVCFSCVSVWILLRSLVTRHWSQTAYLTRNHVVHIFNKKRAASYFPNHHSPWPQSWTHSVCPSRPVLFFLHPGLWPPHQTLVLWLLVRFWDGKHDRLEDGERMGLGISTPDQVSTDWLRSNASFLHYSFVNLSFIKISYYKEYVICPPRDTALIKLCLYSICYILLLIYIPKPGFPCSSTG